MAAGTRAPHEMRAKLIIGSEALDAGSLVNAVNTINSHVQVGNLDAHAISNITELQTELDNKDTALAAALATHKGTDGEHEISGVLNLQSALDSKAALFTGEDTLVDVVTDVDFVGQTVSKTRLTINNGIIIGAVAL